MNSLRIIDACTEGTLCGHEPHSRPGWHAAYPGHVPDDYLRDVITEDHWIPFSGRTTPPGGAGAAAL